MKKTIVLVCSLLMVFMLMNQSPAHAEDRSFTVDQVTIHVDVDEAGVMHVAELFTYSFDGVFGGTERSIRSDASGFKAYEVMNHKDAPTVSVEGLDELLVENDEDLHRIHIPSEGEQKHVLYTYKLAGEIDKYADVADVVYDFFPSSNNSDLGKLAITWAFPNAPGGDGIHAFIRGQDDATVSVTGSEVVYTHDAFKSGMSAELRIIVPAEVVAALPLTEDTMMGEKIIQEEQINMEKKAVYADRLKNIQPSIYIGFVLLIGGMIWWYRKHPNFYRFETEDKRRSELSFLESTDPLFVAYLQMSGYVSVIQNALVAGLLSLKRREIISMEEVSSERSEDEQTYLFTWVKKDAGVDPVDAYLRTWLFQKEGDDEERFRFETIIVDKDEAESVTSEKTEEFTTHYVAWRKLVGDRKAFTGWFEPYRTYGYVSILCTLIAYALFFYVLSISPLYPVLYYSLLGGIGVIALAALIWNKNKWVLSFYYVALLTTMLIAGMWSVHILPIALFIFMIWLALLIVSSRKWAPEVAKLSRLIQVATRLFKRKEYPVDENPMINERRLEIAIALGVGDRYAEQLGQHVHLNEEHALHTPLLNNVAFAGSVFQPSNLIFYTAMASSNSSSSSSSSSTGGTGGAGAF